MPFTLSRAAALVLLPLAFAVLRFGQPLWFLLALVSAGAFESNRRQLSSIARLLSVVVQLGALLGLVAFGVAVASYAESGRQLRALRGVIVVGIAAIGVMALIATVAAIRTLSSPAAEP
jgi:cytochrome bd-type quinol oxidase subunit 1